ncbi:MAG TPA: serine/threonine-protein kinase [Nostocaceae cyanobacterium]|nr:serine/threonine-protein kinase [Nostocaceae cyanobacterium]
MQVYCSRKHANNSSNRFCTLCGEPLPLSVGQVIDNRYQVVRILGQGGFGRSYLAVDKQKAGQQCVLKEFAPQVANPQDLQKAKELFEREANVLKKIQHSQIPRFHSSLQAKIGTKDFFFLVQDYIDGDNCYQLLDQRVSQGKTFSEEEVVKLLHNILPVIAYIHAQDVVHRDISPDNLILRRADNLPVLIDFGGVKQLPASKGFWRTQLAANGTLLGKKGYAPEEQIRQGQVFKSSDLYSLAVTALVLLTGKEPQSLYDSYNGVWYWGKEIKVSPKLEAVLKKMLAYKPSDRYQKAEQVLKDLPPVAITPTSTASTPQPKPANTYLTKLNTMVVAPGRQRTKMLASKFHQRTQLAVQALPIPAWLRPFAVSLIGTTVVVLTAAGAFFLVNSAVRAVSSINLPSLPGISLPQLPQIDHPLGKPVSSKETSGSVAKLLSRRQRLDVPDVYFTQVVNEAFYQQNPQLNGRSLSTNADDQALRSQWLSIGDEFLNKIEQANLSVEARRKLGSYRNQDYENWRRLARAGRLGDYTADRLNRETNEEFDKLFPGQRRGKLNLQTYGQVWYAIAADKVSKAQSR